MYRVLLKNGKPHPELECIECASAIYFDEVKKVWKCSSELCDWKDEGKTR
jgi:ribosomal protein L37AE/L43A